MTPTISRVFLVLICALHIYLSPQPALSQAPVMLYHDCVGKGNYTANSPYQSNLNSLLTSFYTNTDIDYGFYNFTHGDGADTAYGIVLCRPDVTPDSCRACIKDSINNLTTLCPNFKEAVGGADNFMVRYANRDIFHLMEGGPYFWVYSLHNVTNVTGFNDTVFTLLGNLSDKASRSEDGRYKFAVGQMAAPNFQTLYGLVQCTPDLTQSECIECLYNASGLIPKCCLERDGGRVIFPSCNFRYEVSRFYNITNITSPPPPLAITTEKKSNRSRVVVVAVVVPVVSCLMLILCCILLRRMKKDEEKEFDESDYIVEEAESLQVDFETVRMATNNFSKDNKLGQGGFGAVYKGRLPDGQDIAVKRLSKESKQGELEFKNEVTLVAKLQHRNLVRLRGFCFHREERLLLYEFVPNSSLDHYLFGPKKEGNLDWDLRYKILGGIARGLLYLHEDSRLRIIHRDLKASNILLDGEMNPKISDFGMAKMFSINQTQANTNRVVGTFGYMAPEYITRGRFSIKSDIFSFGVLVLEILSGRKINGDLIGAEEESLLTFAWRNWNEGTAERFFDPSLGMGSSREMIRSLHIGLLCVQENEADRPNMAQVAMMLSNYSLALPVPLRPAFSTHSGPVKLERSQSEAPSGLSGNEASITDPYPR